MNPYFLNTGVSVKSGIRAVLANTALIPLLRYPTLEPAFKLNRKLIEKRAYKYAIQSKAPKIEIGD